MENVACVLIPTDFSVYSLRIVLDFMEKRTDRKVELVLACGYDIGDSITSLLGITKEDHLARLESADFIKGCEMIRSRFKNNLVGMYCDLLISRNSRYLRNYFKGSRVTHIVLPEGYTFASKERNVFDITELLKEHVYHIGVATIPVSLEKQVVEGIDSMDSFFFRKDWRVSYE
ncbi:hypothetical protein [Sphingobacterium griseoflavum]|uniref:Glycosyltransferase subfamily 4-like N-terminal domain-containing protein n=1 Tax=Sphingobacterium griseoflavum TaxID=1474952 RepID=A0ABQ3HQI0_9SPHI|nr:hypothetical protein [Sphingobacterium griseoflavum]GHE23531.1 hypothetical protein GCM10017764_04990 [Sphingobacterium griseoflavum]